MKYGHIRALYSEIIIPQIDDACPSIKSHTHTYTHVSTRYVQTPKTHTHTHIEFRHITTNNRVAPIPLSFTLWHRITLYREHVYYYLYTRTYTHTHKYTKTSPVSLEGVGGDLWVETMDAGIWLVL